MRTQPKFKRISTLKEASPTEYVEIFTRAMEGYVVKRYLAKILSKDDQLIITFHNKFGDSISDWYGTKRYNIYIRNITPNGVDSSSFRAGGCMHYLKKEDAYNDAIKLLKDKKQVLNKAIVNLQYALHSVEV